MDCTSHVVKDAQDIFSILVTNNVLQSFNIWLHDHSKIAIVAVLVDALLQNQALHETTLNLGSPENAPDVMRELGRYSKAPNNVLTELTCYVLSDNQVQQLSDMLCDFKKLKKLTISRKTKDFSAEAPGSLGCDVGVGMIGEALRANTVLEKLKIYNTEIGAEEIENLVGALIPDDTSGHQSNTSLLHLSFSHCSVKPGEEREWMQHVSTLLRSNTSILSLDLRGLNILKLRSQFAAEYAEMLFTSLRSNSPLEVLDLSFCEAIQGKPVLGMIMDMLLHNHTLKKIDLSITGLADDGDAEVVYAELRKRDKTCDQGLVKQLEGILEYVPPKSARIFLCGSQEAGKTTLCKRWRDISKTTHKGKKFLLNYFERCIKDEFPLPTNEHERTHGIEVHRMKWGNMDVNVWDMAGQSQYHSFHDLVLPNQFAVGGCSFYFIVCDPKHLKDLKIIEEDIYYWLLFVASNTRETKSYHPHVTILMTHHDMWGTPDQILSIKLKDIVNKLRKMFQDVLDFDKDVEFIAMDNESPPYRDATTVMRNVEEYMTLMSPKLPKVLKASIELHDVVVKWNKDHPNNSIVNWDDFSKGPCEDVKGLKALGIHDKDLLEKSKKLIATCLHNGGYIMYFEVVGMVITNPH